MVFTSVQPGPYSLQVELTGLARLEKTNLTLSASERLAVGDLVLKVGAVTETIVVASEPVPIQTGSSERGAVIDANQITELPTRAAAMANAPWSRGIRRFLAANAASTAGSTRQYSLRPRSPSR